MGRTGSAAVIIAMAAVLWSAMPAVAQQGLTRRVVHPHDPAPTLLEDLAAISGTSAVSGPRSGGQGPADDSFVGGLQTLRLGQALRETQRALVSSAASPTLPPFSPPTATVCICITSEAVSLNTPLLPIITRPPR